LCYCTFKWVFWCCSSSAIASFWDSSWKQLRLTGSPINRCFSTAFHRCKIFTIS
jgi:hypothetical protein